MIFTLPGNKKPEQQTGAAGPGERVLSIDLYRGFALVFMVLIHFGIFYGNEESAKDYLMLFLDHGMADWGAAAFLMMMGMSQVLSAKRFDKPDNLLLFKRALVRGGYIFLVGMLMLILTWGVEYIWWWDILTLMGFATVVLFFCRFLPSWSLVALVAAIMVFTPLLREIFQVAADWEFVEHPLVSLHLPGLYLEPTEGYHPAVLKGFLLSGYFPVFPWIAFIITGFIMGRRLTDGKMRRDLPILVLIGAALVCLGFALGYAGRTQPPLAASFAWVSPLCFYPDSFSLINIQAGVSIIFFSGVYYLIDVRKKDKARLGFLGRVFIQTSNFSLTFYFLHYILLGWSLAILYLITGKYMLSDLMGTAPALLCGLAAVALLEVLLYFWGKAGAKYSLEWFLTRLTRLVAPDYKRGIASTD